MKKSGIVRTHAGMFLVCGDRLRMMSQTRGKIRSQETRTHRMKRRGRWQLQLELELVIEGDRVQQIACRCWLILREEELNDIFQEAAKKGRKKERSREY